jgi:hypothetical protein
MCSLRSGLRMSFLEDMIDDNCDEMGRNDDVDARDLDTL